MKPAPMKATSASLPRALTVFSASATVQRLWTPSPSAPGMFNCWADDPVAISRLSKGTMDPSLSVSMLA